MFVSSEPSEQDELCMMKVHLNKSNGLSHELEPFHLRVRGSHKIHLYTNKFYEIAGLSGEIN